MHEDVSHRGGRVDGVRICRGRGVCRLEPKRNGAAIADLSEFHGANRTGQRGDGVRVGLQRDGAGYRGHRLRRQRSVGDDGRQSKRGLAVRRCLLSGVTVALAELSTRPVQAGPRPNPTRHGGVGRRHALTAIALGIAFLLASPSCLSSSASSSARARCSRLAHCSRWGAGGFCRLWLLLRRARVRVVR